MDELIEHIIGILNKPDTLNLAIDACNSEAGGIYAAFDPTILYHDEGFWRHLELVLIKACVTAISRIEVH